MGALLRQDVWFVDWNESYVKDNLFVRVSKSVISSIRLRSQYTVSEERGKEDD